jgi:hypothetical protein
MERSHRKDKLTWTHVSNLKFGMSQFAAQYGVKQFHTFFLMLQVNLQKDLEALNLEQKL